MLRRAFLPLGVLVLAIVQVHGQSSPEIRKARRPAAGRYIVVLNPTEDSDAVGTASAALHRGRLRHVYRSALKGFAMDLPEPAARALAADPRVRYVEEDAVVSALETQLDAPWGLDRIDQRALPLDRQYGYSLSALPVHVHVLDTGIRTTHVEFGGRAAIAADYIDDDDDGSPYDIGDDDGLPGPDGADCHGHGTHVAGTIGGEKSGVAKTVTLWAHRVLDCSGSGLLSGVVAAVDAVSASAQRPAVANMSLGGGTSTALDDAIRHSIASGVVYVVAAGNDNADAATTSPARVREAITVGATTSSDARAGYSNFGSVLDLFAPGSGIRSAWYTGDTATASISGTSMATPHVAGVAALHLQRNPASSPAAIRDAIVAGATRGVVTGPGLGSPNLLLYSGIGPSTGAISIASPSGSTNMGIGSVHQIKWKHNLGKGSLVKVELSRNGGVTWESIADPVTNGADTGTLKWLVTAPATAAGLLRVTALTGGISGTTAGTLVIAEPFVTVTRPTQATDVWTSGTAQSIQWTSNLGTDTVRIDLSLDGGATYGLVLFAKTKSDGKQKTTVLPEWLSSAARIRIAWVRNPSIWDESAVFTIR
jgi:subtilisin family serine protease